MIGPLFDMFTAAMFFSSVRFLNMCKPGTGWPTWIGILWKWDSMITDLAGDGECRLAQFHVIPVTIFQGCPARQAAFLPGQPAPYNQLLIQPLLLVPECYFA